MSSSNLWWYRLQKTEEDKNSVKQLVNNSKNLLKILSELIEEDIKSLERISSDDYDSPSWAYKQADRAGQLRTLRKILDLIK